MKAFFITISALVCFGLAVEAHASVTECAAYLPAGVVIRMLPDEKLTAGSSSGPTLFTFSSDLRFFPNRPPLLARGSKVLGTIIESQKAGRIYGKARLKIALTSILTSDLCEYPIEAHIIEAGRHKVEGEVVIGRGHAQRDIAALLFPPTTIYQLLRIPSRGPKLVLDNETPLNIKLMEPVSLGEASRRISDKARIEKVEQEFPAVKAASDHRAAPREQQHVSTAGSGTCSPADSNPGIPGMRLTSIVRQVRNLTPCHVSLYLNHRPVLILAPCSGPSMISTPPSEFRLEAVASLVTPGGQKQIWMKRIGRINGGVAAGQAASVSRNAVVVTGGER